jgi:hypothetical protein
MIRKTPITCCHPQNAGLESLLGENETNRQQDFDGRLLNVMFSKINDYMISEQSHGSASSDPAATCSCLERTTQKPELALIDKCLTQISNWKETIMF